MKLTFEQIKSNVTTSVIAFGKRLTTNFGETIKQVTVDSIGWTALIALQAVTIPSLLGLMSGLTDNTPPIDMVIILWVAMGFFYLKSLLEKNMVALFILGLGFISQSLLMALIFFK